MSRTIPRSIIALSAIVSLAACGGDSTAPATPKPGNGSPVGVFAMVAIDGHGLPHMFDQGNVSGGVRQQYFLSGEATFRADSTFSIKLVSKTTGPGASGQPSNTAWSGTWRLEVGGVRLTNSGGVAHWTSSDALGSLDAPGTYTKVSGGKGSLTMKFVKTQ
jgi:hypothetical protein